VEQVQVATYASTPLSHLGLVSYLRRQPGITLLAEAERARADVTVVCCGRLGPEVLAELRHVAAHRRSAIVLVVSEITAAELLVALDCRVVEILPRATVTPERLIDSIAAAARSGGVMPPRLAGELLTHLERGQDETLTQQGLRTGLGHREIDVLRLLAEGRDTDEIASELCYSQRTVTNVIYGLTRRLKLRNRSHAVAYALRAGII
jgi:DNA-binding NarL/FixJ family response regulator